MHTEMLIGDALRGRHRGLPRQILNPRTGATDPRGSRRPRQTQVDAAVAAAATAFDDLVAHHAGASAPATSSSIADRIEAEADAFAALEALNCGKPINAVLQRRDPGDRRLLALLRRRGALPCTAPSPANISPATPR